LNIYDLVFIIPGQTKVWKQTMLILQEIICFEPTQLISLTS